MRILVLGCNGFIGTHCINFFLKNGFDVHGADIFNYARKGNINYTELNVNDTDYDCLFKYFKFDLCINCSGSASVINSFNNPYNDFKTNTINVFKILDSIRKYQFLCKFINLSSAAVYGNPLYLPIKDTHAVDPISPYGFHKHFAEQICSEYSKIFGIKTVSLRIFSVYGPGLKKQIFWDVYSKFKSEEKVFLFGTGNETRDFIYIDDLLRQIWLVINNAEFRGESFNLANGEELKINEVVSVMQRIMNSKKEIIFDNIPRIGDPINWQADISNLISWGYKKTIELDLGVTKFLQWVDKEQE